MGEYEMSLLDLVKALDKNTPLGKIKGIAYKEKGKVIINPRRENIEDLDKLPFPAWHLMPMDMYFTPYSRTKTSIEVLTSRGCPFKCTYCVFPQLIYNSRKVRYRSAKSVVDEVEILLKKYKKEGIYFNDDTFTVNRNHVMGICGEIMKRKLKFRWGCFGRVDTVDREMLENMKRAGCVLIKYGVESGSQKILDRVEKGYKISDIKKAFKLTKEIGIGTHGTFMIGLPGEDSSTIEETMELAKEIDADTILWALLTPFPGTALFDEAEKKGHIEEKNWEKYDGDNYVIMRTDSMSREEIKNAWIYVKNKWLLHKKKNKDLVKQFVVNNYREVGIFGLGSRSLASFLKIARNYFNTKTKKSG
jgi:radical SAM superfamily enzyme YgiQ (UPF0313 family)